MAPKHLGLCLKMKIPSETSLRFCLALINLPPSSFLPCGMGQHCQILLLGCYYGLKYVSPNLYIDALTPSTSGCG